MSGQSGQIAAATADATHEVESLRCIAEGTARSTGDEFFRTLVRHLAAALGVRYALVSECKAPHKIRTLAYWSDGRIVDNVDYDLPGTPCERVINGSVCHIPHGVQREYPETKRGIEGYLGAPLRGRDGTVLGHLCAFSEKPLPAEPRTLLLFEIFSARCAAELDRLLVEQRLRDSEARLEDLFDEAPIAYVHEGLDSQFIRANRAALRAFGIRAEEVRGCKGTSFVPDTPEAQQRVQAALASIGKGTDTSGVVLELRRRDGRPLWVQWWSKPDPSGHYTRTMFLDITERVLMEQEQARLREQNVYLREEIKSVHNFEEIVGASAGLRSVLDRVQRVAPTDATTLILGETGTGKELIARAIHSISGRADKPLIKVNLAALSPGLVESELFGHERGAFSGAIQRHVGRFELAHNGTIFLDEIGEMPRDVQTKLLRVLQEREFERVGGNQTIKADVRVIAATNRDLQKAMREGSFRADLFYRLNVFPLELPPLRERRQDIPLLVQFFIQRCGPRIGRRVDSIEPDSMARLQNYPWPGNIRELENIIERALILATTPTLRIDTEFVPLSPASGKVATPAAVLVGSKTPGDLNEVQREHILGVLQSTNWVVEGERGAAACLGMKPATLRHRMKKLGISRSTHSGR